MKVLFVNADGVHALLPMKRCVALMHETLSTFADGDAVLPLRTGMRLPDGSGLIGMMPGYLGKPRSFGLKVVSVMPGNHGTGYGSHQGVVMLYGIAHGEPLAIMDAAASTAIRTAAASAAATDALANPDAGDLALIGAGVEGRTHLAAMAEVRPLRRVRIWSRSRENAERFAHEEAGIVPVPIEVMTSAEEAVRMADIICTTTSARTPVVQGAWLSPGAHLNAVGSCFPSAQEIDSETVRRSRFFTDCRESCLKEAGDYLTPLTEGVITAAHLLGEIGEVFTGRIAGRTSRDDITVYESLGIALEDLAAAHEIHARAVESGAGTWLDWGGPP
jgi:ornithine cyclodeaminase